MYNDDQKTTFIRESTRSISTAFTMQGMFKLSEAFENKFGKDLCEFSDGEIAEFISSAAPTRIDHKRQYKSTLRLYFKWCNKNGLCDVIPDIDVEKCGSLEKIRSQFVVNPVQMQMRLDNVFEPEEWNTIHCTYRAFLWLAFIGLSTDEAINLRASDVDMNSMRIRCCDFVYKIPTEAAYSLSVCASRVNFAYKHPNYTADFIYRDRVPGDKILRGIKSDAVNPIKFIDTISALTREKRKAGAIGNENVTFKKASISGVFYRMYMRETAGLPIDFTEDALMMATKGSRSSDDKKSAVPGHPISQIKSSLKKDYEQWKLAFDL